MIGKQYRIVVALLLGLIATVFTNNLAASAPTENSYVLGQKCPTIYASDEISSNESSTIKVAGICFPANNDSATIWSLDMNRPPIYELVNNNDSKTAFGRTCPSDVECVIPKNRDEAFFLLEPFVKAYPDVEFKDIYGGRWWSATYESKIVKVSIPLVKTETSTAGSNNSPAKINGSTQLATFVAALTAFVSISTSAALPTNQNQPNQNQPKTPEALELRARKERRFAKPVGLRGFFDSDLITLDRWSIFNLRFPAQIRKVGRISSAAATSIGDGDYLRAALGVFSLLLYPISIAVGIAQYFFRENGSLVPELKWLTLAILLGCIDSLAGAFASATYILLVAVNFLSDPVYVGFGKKLSILVIIFTLTTGPGLFAGAMRRFDGVHTNRKGRWERMVDYALSPLITSWIVWKVLEALTPLIFIEEKQKHFVEHWQSNIHLSAIFVFVVIFARYSSEAYVAKHHTDRINEIVCESMPLEKLPKIIQYIRKSIWIYIFTSSFSTPGKALILAALFLLPALAVALDIKPMQVISKINIIGIPRLVLLLGIGLFLSSSYISKTVVMSWKAFAIAAFPVLYFNIMEAVSESHFQKPAYFYQNRFGRFLYRLGAILLYVLIIITIENSGFFKGLFQI
jgi:hypothetical protein